MGFFFGVLTMKSPLATLVTLKSYLKRTEHQIDTIMPEAINAALQVELDKNRTVYEADKGKVILTLRKKVPTIKQSKELTRLDELMVANQTSLANRHAKRIDRINAQIAEHQQAIADLEQQREELLTNKHLIQLKSDFIQQKEQESWMQPSLAVYLV